MGQQESKVIIWSKERCHSCINAKNLLAENGLQYEERVLDQPWSKEQLLEKAPNARLVPQIFIDNIHIGGYNDLVGYFNSK